VFPTATRHPVAPPVRRVYKAEQAASRFGREAFPAVARSSGRAA
jgi:hypothetical protein